MSNKQETIDVILASHPANKRTCDLVKTDGAGCMAYSETSDQTRNKVMTAILFSRTGILPASAKDDLCGTCKVTGATVQIRAKCGVSDKRLRDWLTSEFTSP